MTVQKNGDFITVSAREVWDKLTGLEKAIDKLGANVEAALRRIDTQDDEIKRLNFRVYVLAAGIIAGITSSILGL